MDSFCYLIETLSYLRFKNVVNIQKLFHNFAFITISLIVFISIFNAVTWTKIFKTWIEKTILKFKLIEFALD